MNIHPVRFPRRNSLADLYINDFEQTAALYSYNPYEQDSFQKRLYDVQKSDGHAERSQLTNALLAYNERVNPHQAVRDNIRSLERTDSVTVIGGQQAGVMTGPLYTIHKAITILQLARQQSEKLHVPVVPVFWIAGEDHDWEEVNHIWTYGTSVRPEKVRLRVDDEAKLSVGRRKLKKVEVDRFLKAVADFHPDSPFKNMWLKKLHELAAQSETLSDWFARIFHSFFAHEGLVLFDSAADEFKSIAAPFYIRLIVQADDLNKAVVEGTRMVERLGFRSQVDVEDGRVNLFVEEGGERKFLVRRGGMFVTKDGGATYSTSELTDMASTHPEKLSTNVITRPLMQSYLFPTLAAVLGPGEIAYWGQYGKAFALFGWTMPILFPRVGFTLVEREVGKTMASFRLSPVKAMFQLAEFREQWLREQDDIGIETLFADFAEELKKLHEVKTEPVLSLNRGMAELVQKNRERITRELSYLEKQAVRAVRLKHDATLKQFDRVQFSLMPNGKPQERVYNVFAYINQYGWDWLNALIREPVDLRQSHYMVKL